jgi:hypothetical protein
MATLGTEGAWLFGVSMGLLISSKNPNIEDWDPLVNELKSEFLTAGITIYIDGEGVPIGVNPWRLTTSDALSKNSSPGQCERSAEPQKGELLTTARVRGGVHPSI